MKRLFSFIISLTLVLALVILPSTVSHGEALKTTIVTSGEAVLELSPDMVYINIGVISEDELLVKARDDARLKMNQVMKSLEELKIPKEDIRTIGFSVSPKYTWNEKENKSEISGYSVRNTIEVRIYDIEKSSALIDGVIDAGGNYVNGLRFDLRDRKASYNEALKLAVTEARDKALVMASVFGVTEITPVMIQEQGSSPIYYSAPSMVREEALDMATPISPGEIQVRASVMVEFNY